MKTRMVMVMAALAVIFAARSGNAQGYGYDSQYRYEQPLYYPGNNLPIPNYYYTPNYQPLDFYTPPGIPDNLYRLDYYAPPVIPAVTWEMVQNHNQTTGTMFDMMRQVESQLYNPAYQNAHIYNPGALPAPNVPLFYNLHPVLPDTMGPGSSYRLPGFN